MRLVTAIIGEIGKIKRVNAHLKWSDLNRKGAKTSFIISRLCYIGYFLFDNLVILAKIKLINVANRKKLALYSYIFWLLGLVTSFSYNVFLLRISYALESNLKYSMINNKTPKQAYDSLMNISKDRQKILFNLIRNTGDIAIAANGTNLPKMLLKTNFNYGLIAVAGLCSSAVGMYQCYQKVKKQGDSEFDLYDRGE